MWYFFNYWIWTDQIQHKPIANYTKSISKCDICYIVFRKCSDDVAFWTSFEAVWIDHYNLTKFLFIFFRTYRTVTYLDGDVDMRTPSIRNKTSGNPSPTAPASINPTRSSLRNTVQRSKTFSSTKERKYHQQPLKHTNSRISEIIRQYNQANEMLAKPGVSKTQWAKILT